MNIRTDAACGRTMSEKDSHLSNLNMPLSYLAILQIARLYMQSVAHPPSMAWMAALSGADQDFDEIYGPQVAARTLETLQRVRLSRRSLFNFNSPTCPSCCQFVTEHERRFMTALDCIRSGRTGQAKIELIMLCEGNDVMPTLDAMDRLNKLISAFLSAGASDPKYTDDITQRPM